jgi:hypothetical protein
MTISATRVLPGGEEGVEEHKELESWGGRRRSRGGSRGLATVVAACGGAPARLGKRGRVGDL